MLHPLCGLCALPRDTNGVSMLIHDGTFSWKGFGGKLRLGSGRCSLQIFDLTKDRHQGLAHLRPTIVIVSDIPDSGITIRSCAGHIATTIALEFNLDPQRMLYLEYYPEVIYGDKERRRIPERYDAVDFSWHDHKALNPRWRTLKPPMLDSIQELAGQAKSK